MATLPDTFFQVVSARLADHPQLKHQWSGPEKSGKRVLRIPKADDTGFDVTIECEPYGLYPFADGWHGAPWDAPHDAKTRNEAVCEDCLGFLRSVLCADATLTIWHSSGRPYKWILSYPVGGTRASDETGVIFFNYFGKREQRVYQNRHLPPREPSLQPNNRLQRDAAQAPRA